MQATSYNWRAQSARSRRSNGSERAMGDVCAELIKGGRRQQARVGECDGLTD